MLARFLHVVAPTTVALALCWCAARTAHASCAMAIDGDPDAVTDIEAALYSFGQDEVPCVAVRVLCSRDANQFVVDLHDQLGRSVQRRFLTAAGAAAFVISWSRRPLPQDGTGLTLLAPPAPAAPPTLARPLAPPPPDVPRSARVAALAPAAGAEVAARAPGSPLGLADPGGRHGELHAAYVPVAGNGFIVEGTLVRHRGIWQYGGAVRTVASWPVERRRLDDGATESMWFLSEAEVLLRTQWARDRLIVRGEVAAGGGVLGLWTDIGSSPYFQALGVRGGARAMVLAQLVSSLYLEAIAGTEIMVAAYTTNANNVLAQNQLQIWPHVELGLLWAL